MSIGTSTAASSLLPDPLPPWLDDVWNASHLYPSFCVLACWRNESQMPNPLGEVKGHGCNARLHRCPCEKLDASRRARLSASASTGGHEAIITHAVVMAARFTRVAMATAMIERHARSTLNFLPAKGSTSIVVVVDNGSPKEAADALRTACEQHSPFLYATNEAWQHGYGYELGAWRWAIRTVLPSLHSRHGRPRLAEDAVLYLMQDSVALAHAALPYPPPIWFHAASLISYRTEGHGAGIPLIGVPRHVSSAIEANATRAALSMVTDAPEVVTPNKTYPSLLRFMSNFGPNLLVTWRTARRLQERGFFDMIQVRSKLDEQISERVIGYFLTHDREMRHSACSVGGDISSHLSRCAARRSCNVGAFEKLFLGRGD